MNAIIRALIWEQLWRNKVVIPAIGVLLGVGGFFTYTITHGNPYQLENGTSELVLVFAFFISLLFTIAPFGLIESNAGWRMNSISTRWFILPVSTVMLVLISLVISMTAMTLTLLAWKFVAAKIVREFDTTYFWLVQIACVAGIQALGWILPRRPSQYWPLVGLLFIAALIVGLVPQEDRNWAAQRYKTMWWVASTIPVFFLISWQAARLNRRGDWSGEIPFTKIWQSLLGIRPRPNRFRSAWSALLLSDTLGSVFGFVMVWLVVAAGATLTECWALLQSRPHLSLTWGFFSSIALHVVPLISIVWLAVGSLFIGCEFTAGFRTRLSSFRATLPVDSGVLAGQRIGTALLLWLAVWLPIIALTHGASMDFTTRATPDMVRESGFAVARCMAISAYLLIGALPILLWGRIEGFPNILLVTILSCAPLPWLLNSEPTAIVFLGCWVAGKVGVAIWGLTRSIHKGQATWKFAVSLLLGWIAACAALIWILPTWRHSGLFGAAMVAALMPLARLAFCPMAIDANRHR